MAFFLKILEAERGLFIFSSTNLGLGFIKTK